MSKPSWSNVTNHFPALYSIEERLYGSRLPGLYVSLEACAKAIYENEHIDSPTEEQIAEIAETLDEEGEYESDYGRVYTYWSHNIWDIE